MKRQRIILNRAFGYKIFIYLFTVFIIATFNFILIRFMPGDPVEHLIGEEDYLYLQNAHPEVLEEKEKEYGLDGTLGKQYVVYLNKLLHGDFGQSFKNKCQVSDLIMQRLGFTMRLIFPAVVLASLLGILLGAIAGYYKGSVYDRIVTRLSLMFYSVPSYCLGMLFLMVFSFYLGIFPSGGISSGGLEGAGYWKDLLWHMVLPVGVLTIGKLSYNVQIMRSSMIEVCQEEYVTVAKTKGLSTNRILLRHILPNAALPMVTVITMQMGFIVSGSMMIEMLFNWDGMGMLVYQAVMNKDYPVLQGSLLILTIFVIGANILSDLFCAMIDPRVKDGRYNEA